MQMIFGIVHGFGQNIQIQLLGQMRFDICNYRSDISYLFVRHIPSLLLGIFPYSITNVSFINENRNM